jgi:LDH2 family malate/lactate/ureidoglycolate dehydrogenase
MNQQLFQKQFLQEYLTEMYTRTGMAEPDAAVCADCTLLTNLWGIDSHGILRTPAYINRIRSKAVNAAAKPFYARGENGPLSVMDGDAGMGYTVGRRAMDEAVEKAKNFGFGMIIVRNSNHFGAASLYTRQAADAGMLGIATTNVIPNIGMPGNRKSVTGNNPLALAAPIGKPYPFSLDISMSAVSGGKLLLAQKKGEKIPDTWAIDADGNPTDDPFAGFAGILLPTGLHKGLGLSLFIDIITGVLSGGPFLQDIKSMYKQKDEPSLTSHLFCVIDPGFFMDAEEFSRRMESWVKMIKETPMAEPGTEQIIPGEIEYRLEQERLTRGIPVPEELVRELQNLEAELGMTCRLEPDLA